MFPIFQTHSVVVKEDLEDFIKNLEKIKEEDRGEESECGDTWAEPWKKRLRKKKKYPMKDEGNISNDVTVKVECVTLDDLSTNAQVKDEANQQKLIKEPKEEVKNPTEEEEDEEEDMLEEGGDLVINESLDTDEENPADKCETFLETNMEVNDKERTDPSRFCIVAKNQKQKRRKIKEKLRGRSKKRGADSDSYDAKKKRQRKQENPRKKSKKNFACDICREELGNDEELNNHRRMKHINEKSEFFCDFCLKIFKTKAILKGHRYKHITDPQFLCVRCGKKYFTISNLNEHSLYCLDEKKFECPVCNKKFNVNKQFKRHLVIHEADRYIKCTVCEQTFSRKDNYRQHFRRHTGEKPYTCDICGKSFRIKATYNYHRRTHRDVRPGDIENLKTENVNEVDYSVFRTPRKDNPTDSEFYCQRPEGENEFARVPRRDVEFVYASPVKDGSFAPEYYVKREPSESSYPSRKDSGASEENFAFRENDRKEDKEEKKEVSDYSQRLNIDYVVSATGTDYIKRDPSRPHIEFCPRKEVYPGREIPSHPEYLARRVGVITEDYQSRGGADFHPRIESIIDTQGHREISD